MHAQSQQDPSYFARGSTFMTNTTNMTKPPIRKKPRAQSIQPLPVESPETLETTSWQHFLADRSKINVPAWVVLPLRLFLGVTFTYAGLQKLTDPHYFDPSAQDFIGNQIKGF